jgi:hypothetical protein
MHLKIPELSSVKVINLERKTGDSCWAENEKQLGPILATRQI